VKRVQDAEQALGAGFSGLATMVALVYAKLLSYKDEYEVARLFTQSVFQQQLGATFSGDVRLKFHLAPSLLSRRDPATGRLRKAEFGPWVLRLFSLLARLRGLRGTMFDPFGASAHRRIERALIVEYEQLVEVILSRLNSANYAAAVELAGCYEAVRGYDVVKEESIARMRAKLPAARAAFEAAATAQAAHTSVSPKVERTAR
jgi:indolepyruvate ferredoxin oxidoreductase